MGRSPGGLIAAQSHIKMNKLLLALAAGSSEEENRVESFESGLDREAREADPARRQRKDQAKRKNQTEGKNQAQRKNQAKRKNKAEKKNQAKRKNQAQRKNQAKRKNKAEEKRKNQAQRKKQAKRSKAEKENQAKRKNKKGKSNKRNGLKAKRGGKGQKGKRNNRKNGNKSGKGKKNRKAERNQKKKGKNKNMTGNQNRKNTAEARQCRVTTTCSDTAVAAHKLMKDKVDNFVKQHKRITKKTNIGSKKSNKNDVFKPVLQRLAAAAGGNISAPVCSGSSNNSGAAQMLNLSITLKNCEDDIYAACDPSNLPNHNQSKIAECYAAIDIFTNYTDTCSDLSGAAACDCWIPSANVTAAMAEIKLCDLSSNNTATVNATKACKAAFGKCRKYEDDVGDIIHSCEQNADTLKLKLKALSDNSDKVGQVATKVDALVNATRRNFASGRSAMAKRDASTAAF